MDELELHGLLLLDGGQQLLEVLALLRDVAVLQPLLLAAVTADQLRPLLGVLRCDVLNLRKYTNTQASVSCTSPVCPRS